MKLSHKDPSAIDCVDAVSINSLNSKWFTLSQRHRLTTNLMLIAAAAILTWSINNDAIHGGTSEIAIDDAQDAYALQLMDVNDSNSIRQLPMIPTAEIEAGTRAIQVSR